MILRTHGVCVTASNGVITLTGFVHSYATKLAAERSIKRLRGVRAVANDIQVALRSERTDPEIAKDAMYALGAHTGVPDRITVTVRDGFMTLGGSVEWMFQKEAAGSAVMHLEGVKKCLKPDSGRAERVGRSDQDRHRRCASAQRGRRAHRISVSVGGSIVTLSGHVRSCHEKQEAERAAWAAPGVTGVENLIVVTP